MSESYRRADDVSLKELLGERDHRYEERDRRYTELRAADREAVAKAELAAKEALGVAKAEATERLTAHNGLLDKMEAQAATFALRETSDERFRRLEQWQAKINGALLLVAAVGLANLVKVWLS